MAELVEKLENYLHDKNVRWAKHTCGGKNIRNLQMAMNYIIEAQTVGKIPYR